MGESNFESRIKGDVKDYAKVLMNCLQAGVFSGQSREAAIGSLAYLVEEHDIVADDVPNIGMLDDAIALVGAAKLLGEVHDLGSAIPRERVEADYAAYQDKARMMYTNLGAVSLEGLSAQGRRVENEEELFKTLEDTISLL